MNRMKYYLLLLLAAFSLGANAQTDFFGIQKMTVGGEEYSLVWSAKIKFRYVEDFLPKKASNNTFTSKVSLDFYNADVELEKVVNFKMAEFEASKEENRLANLQKSVASNGDVLIEYVTFAQNGEKMRVAEWNICRFVKNGEMGVVQLQTKHREYDIKMDKFMLQVEKKRTEWVNDIVSYKIPTLTVKE